ncbi:MAG: carboxylesterase family protein, partial [Pseudobutyrivibrio sp.]|nr:carboxylesterase family protein [Pseudobutyrivibrio sp.]
YAMEWGPVVDGEYMPTNPVTDNGFAEVGKNVTLLIGSNLNEWSMVGASPSDEDVTDEVKEAFMQAFPNEDVSEITRFDTLLRYPLLKITRHKAMQEGAPVYSYIFTYDDTTMGAVHGAEIPYVFNHVEGEEMSTTMSQAWANFARNGVPSSDNLPEWEPYTLATGAEMIIDNESYMSYDHDIRLLQLLKPEYNLN